MSEISPKEKHRPRFLSPQNEEESFFDKYLGDEDETAIEIPKTYEKKYSFSKELSGRVKRGG